MRASLLQDTLTARVQAHFGGQRVRPALVLGPPGVGKTQMTADIARHLSALRGEDVGFITHHAPLMLDQDFGMPWPKDGELEFVTSGTKFPFVDSDCPDYGVLQVDEVAQCDNSQQKIWANIFQERNVHGRQLKPGWYITATGNRLEDRAGASRILSHFNDRFTTYTFEPNVEDWITWAAQHGVRPEVIGFIRWRPDLLSKFDPNSEKSPTPRAWAEGVSVDFDIGPQAAMFDNVKGNVGEGPAAEFTGFVSTYRSLPDPDAAIARPDLCTIPTEPHVLFAFAAAVAHRARPDTFANVITLAKRFPSEFMVLVMRDACRFNPELENTSEYIRWCATDGARALVNHAA